MLSEIFRAGLNAVPKGQMEAGLSTGLTYVETMRTIVLPQAFKSMIPAIVSQLISLIKDTSLAVIISLPELTHQARIIYGQNTNYVLPMFVAMTFMYFVVCYALSLLSFLSRKKQIQLLNQPKSRLSQALKGSINPRSLEKTAIRKTGHFTSNGFLNKTHVIFTLAATKVIFAVKLKLSICLNKFCFDIFSKK